MKPTITGLSADSFKRDRLPLRLQPYSFTTIKHLKEFGGLFAKLSEDDIDGLSVQYLAVSSNTSNL